ncbi:disease resistance protein [Striga asiatica]|uniref:Disease resistance protein n=1 Tax=Striga asiatica TaxID=4170 RepID=A0A5A7Q687_STRAF|nr:disease resistance protein [Striga asiatica]
MARLTLSLSNTPHGISRNRGIEARTGPFQARMIALKPVIERAPALHLLVKLAHELRHLKPYPPHIIPQKLHPVHLITRRRRRRVLGRGSRGRGGTGGPGGGNLDRYGVVYGPQGRYSGEVVGPVHLRVDVNHREPPPLQSRKNLGLQYFPMMRRIGRPRLSRPWILKISSFLMSLSCSDSESIVEIMEGRKAEMRQTAALNATFSNTSVKTISPYR